ncbi:MAG: tetratricopeptide (TPR) repeat protein [Gammaproteobacteria bacterium]|jgi:tetratricopeptide (TPR) repeat protein
MSDVAAYLDTARAHHNAGRLDDAQASYRRVLATAPDDATALHLLGVVCHQRGDSQQACTLIAQACQREPDNAEFARNFALVLSVLDRRPEATAQLQRALRLEPENVQARLQLASVHHQGGAIREALRHYQLALEAVPDLADLHNQIGVCHLQLDDLASALDAFSACLQRDPQHGDARENLGRALLRGKRFDEAQAHLDALLADQPLRDEASHLLGFVRLHQGHLQDASQHFLTPVRRRFAVGSDGGASPADASVVTRTKLVNDIQQLEYLESIGAAPTQQVTPLLAPYRAALAALPAETRDRFFFDAPPVAGFSEVFNRLHVEKQAPQVDTAAVSLTLDHERIESTFQRDGWAVIDDFLSAEALAALRRFCNESTIWFEKKFRNEVGASLRNGFCCPALLQVAEETRMAFPDLLAEHLFTGCFSYKYFGVETEGNVHADRGAISLNLWITPDAANLDPQRGGLLIWNKRVPSNYFDCSPQEIDHIHEQMVSAADARPSIIAYRSNRAMLFRSDVLHKSDRMHFAPDYENRRVSLTFLYGHPG